MTHAHPDAGTIERLAELPPAERRRVADHLGRCVECRCRLAADDPSRIFSLLGTRFLPAGLLDEVSAAVSETIRGGERREPLRTAWLRVGSLAAGLALAAFLGIGLAGSPEPVAGPAAALEVAAPTSVATKARPARLGLDLRDADAMVQVLDLTVGETQVVMIFDERLEL
jgi:anti-sigma factor RsiW